MDPVVIIDGEVCWNPEFQRTDFSTYTFIHNQNIVAVIHNPHATHSRALTTMAWRTSNGRGSTQVDSLGCCRVFGCTRRIKWQNPYLAVDAGATCDECHTIICNIPINALGAQYTCPYGKYLCYSAENGYNIACIRVMTVWWPQYVNEMRGMSVCHICERMQECNCKDLSRRIFIDIMIPKYLLMGEIIGYKDVLMEIMEKIICGC